MNEMKTVPLGAIKLTGGFWRDRCELVANGAVPYQWKALNNGIPGVPQSHAVENFRIAAGEASGKPQGTIFQDSDAAKWIEAAAYTLLTKPDPDLEARIDELVRLVEKSQLDDGYVNTYFIAAAGLEKRWSDLVMGHELYCAGHMIEAAVAYFKVTGKRRLLNVMCRYADYIGKVFGPDKDQNPAFDGHPEIELALHRLAEATGEKKYADLANHFVNVRGTVPNFYKGEAAMEGMIPKSRWFKSDYYLADKPVREMTAVEGHSVRAMYLYSAMADQYRMTGERALLDTLHLLWESAAKRHMYVTAGIGSQSHGERFTIDYDLPNDTCYTETCASIGLALWAWRMLLIEPKREYADVMERAMYNGILSGISLDGTKYFYVNPLEMAPEAARYRHDQSHVAAERVGWFDCACCPTNTARFIASISGYLATASAEGIWIHHYASGNAELEAAGQKVALGLKTGYPWNGDVELTVVAETRESFTLALRIPGWCSGYALSVNGETVKRAEPDGPAAGALRTGIAHAVEDGYVKLARAWKKGDRVKLALEMPVRFLKANPFVREDAGKVAAMRGPVVYCAEGHDNGALLSAFTVDPAAGARLSEDPSLHGGAPALDLDAFRESDAPADAPLYREYHGPETPERRTLRLIPYYQWGNRTPGNEMLVWLRLAGK